MVAEYLRNTLLWAEASSGSGGTEGFLLILVLTVVFFVLLRSRRSATSATSKIPASRQMAHLGHASGHPARPTAELQHWEVEMHELARDLSGRLDSKLSALQQLVIQADARIARLEELLGERVAAGRNAEPEPAPTSPAFNRSNRIGINDPTEPFPMPALKLPEPPPTAAGASATGSDERYAAIYELSDTGLTAARIAERLGTPVGEVELILSLRRRREG